MWCSIDLERPVDQLPHKPVGVGLHITTGDNVWRIPFGLQLLPAGIMAFGLLTVKESPRWLASKGRTEEALANLAYLRKLSVHDEAVRAEMAEIEAAIEEEREVRKGLGLREAFLGKGNFVRFVIAVVIFILQQWGGQNSVNYYAPQIFTSVSALVFYLLLSFLGLYTYRSTGDADFMPMRRGVGVGLH